MPSGLARIRVNYGTANSDRFAGRVTGGREIHLGDAREREMPQDGLPLCGIGDEQRGGEHLAVEGGRSRYRDDPVVGDRFSGSRRTDMSAVRRQVALRGEAEVVQSEEGHVLAAP